MNTDTNGCVKSEFPGDIQLSSPSDPPQPQVVALGEVLWDVYGDSRRLGGAALNFGAHARRLGHPITLITAVGLDEPGQQAMEMIEALDLDTRLLQITSRHPTGAAEVRIASDGKPQFTIIRPAAYDAVDLTPAGLESLRSQNPAWVYYGTLFASTEAGKDVLLRLLSTLDRAFTFYDVNLRPGSDSAALVRQLLMHADVVKINEEELVRVAEFTGLPSEMEAFCREGASRYGWQAAAVTLGDRGCGILANGQYAEAVGHPVDVVDTVGAGDAFSAAFMHGISLGWPVEKIATFANRVGALVASRHGAIPEWTFEEALKL